jgi:apolipoprotein N-acyltransferase
VLREVKQSQVTPTLRSGQAGYPDASVGAGRSPRRFGRGRQVEKFKSIVLCVLSGVLLALPFCNGRLWVFSWIGFAPLFFALQNISRVKAFFISYITGIIFWSITIYWLIHVTLLGQVLLILYLALYFGIFGLAINHKLSAISYIFIPCIWVLLEYLRSHLLTGFGWALLGYSQYLNLPVIQIADLFGAYGVSFLVMMMNVAIYSITGYRLQVTGRRSAILLSVVCLLLALCYGYYTMYLRPARYEPQPIKISVIQGNIPQELKWAEGSKPLILEKYIKLTGQASDENSDLIIWPEASNPGLFGESEDEWVSQAIFAACKDNGIPLLFGSAVIEKEKYFNSALLIDADGALIRRYDKLHLVPFGEYVPLKKIFPFLETIVPVGDFTPGKEYTLFKLPVASDQLPAASHLSQVTPTLRSGQAGHPDASVGAGRSPRRFGRGRQVTFASLICFEDTIPELSRNFVTKGARFLVNITNDAWFGRTSSPYQHLAASVFRAVENRVPLARSANTGVSCFIDASGRITAKVSRNGNDIFVDGIKTGVITLDKRKSIYSFIGDIFVLGCFAIVGICGIIAKSRQRILFRA